MSDTTTFFQQALDTARRNLPYAQDARQAAKEALQEVNSSLSQTNFFAAIEALGGLNFFAAVDALGGHEAVMERLIAALESEPDPYDHLAVMAASTFAYTGRERTRTEIRYRDTEFWYWEEYISVFLASMGIPIVERRDVFQKEITQTFPDGHQVTAWERQDTPPGRMTAPVFVQITPKEETQS